MRVQAIEDPHNQIIVRVRTCGPSRDRRLWLPSFLEIAEIYLLIYFSASFWRAMLCISAAYAVVRCPSVLLSVTFVYSVEMNKRILNFLLRQVATPFYFFIPSIMAVSRFIACCQPCDRQVLSTRCHRTMTSWRHSSLVAVSVGVCWWRETDDEAFMTRSINVTPKTAEQHLIVRASKTDRRNH